MLRRVLLPATIAVLILASFGISAAQTTYDGIWYSAETETAIQIENGTATVMEPSAEGCTPSVEFTLEGDDVLLEGVVVYALQLEGDTLTVLENDSPVVSFERVDSLEGLCMLLPITVSTETLATWVDVDALFGEVFAQTNIPGMAIAIVGTQGVLWSNGYGVINTETQQPVTADTPFMLASVSKTVTGTALMIAWQETGFDLDGNINDWLPFVVDNPHVEGEVITPRHLATHTSTILDYYPVYDSVYVTGDSPIALGDFLQGYLVEGGEWYNADANYADRMPGVTWEYSNVGAALAGYLVERITGEPLDRYSEEHIFGPLQMSNTHWFLADYADTSIIASPHDADGQPMEHYGFPTWPDGQLRSSVNDLGRLLAATMNGGELDGVRILETSTVEMMLQPQIPAASETQYWFWYQGDELTAGFIGHGGGDDGVSTLMIFNPDLQIGLVILTNTSSNDVSRAFQAFMPVIMANAETLLNQ